MMVISHEAIGIEFCPVLLLISSEVCEAMILELLLIYESERNVDRDLALIASPMMQ